MAHKFHRGFTAAEKTELWDRWKRGESLKAIGRAFGKQSAGTDEAGHAFQFEAGRVFRSEAGHPWRQSHGSI